MEEIAAEKVCGPLIDVSQVNFALVIGAGLTLVDGDSELLGKGLHGFGETDTVLAHEKLEDASSGATAETLEDAFGRTDAEGRGLFFMEGTQAKEVSSGPFEGDVLADDLDDIGGVLHLADCSMVYHCASTLSLGCKVPTEATTALSIALKGFWAHVSGAMGSTKPVFRYSRAL